jgi:hypothetical protein
VPGSATPALEGVQRPSRRALLAVYGSVAVVLGLIALIDAAGERSMGFLTRDPAYATSLEGCERASCGYAGLLSQLGVLLMAGVVAAAALGAWRAPASSRPRALLLSVAVVSAVVTVDDAFMVHDALLAYVHPAGEKAALLTIAAVVAAFAAVFGRDLLAGPAVLLGVCAVAFGLSVAVDQLLDDPPRLLEDGAKFVGLVTWALWVTLLVRVVLSPPAAAP